MRYVSRQVTPTLKYAEIKIQLPKDEQAQSVVGVRINQSIDRSNNRLINQPFTGIN